MKEEQWDLQSYFRLRDELEMAKSDMTTVKGIHIPDAREAALGAVNERYKKKLDQALRLLAGILDSWRLADALAEALVYEIVTPKSEKATQRSAIMEASEFPFRYFFHTVIEGRLSPIGFCAVVVNKWNEQFDGAAIIEDYGWLQGSVACTGGYDGSPDAAYFIVRVKDDAAACKIKAWFGQFGAVRISSPQMLEIDISPLEKLVEKCREQEVRSLK